MPTSLVVPDIADRHLHWMPLQQLPVKPDPQWQHWLLDPGSLTQLLLGKSDGQFKVQLQSEAWVNIDSSSLAAKFGPVDSSHRFWSRKVILHGKGRPWVLAHTLVPEHSLCSPLRKIMQLKEQPLGEYLFSHPDLQRSAIDISPFYETNDGNPAGLTSEPECSWGRRSLFFLFGKPVMVAEFFLQQLFQE